MGKKTPNRRFTFWNLALILKATKRWSNLDLLEQGSLGKIHFEVLDVNGDYIPVEASQCKYELSLGDPTMFYGCGGPVNDYTITDTELKRLLPREITIAKAEGMAAALNDLEMKLFVGSIPKTAVGNTNNQAKTPTSDKAVKNQSSKPTSGIMSEKILGVAKKEMPHLSASRYSKGKNHWNISKVAEHLHSNWREHHKGGTIPSVSAIRKVLGSNLVNLPLRK